MKHITFYLDFISPYAWLAFEKLPEALAGLSYRVSYRPVLLGALLRHHGQLGPAEIPAKRDWTYRHVLWLGHTLGVPLRMPAVHPFNPLPLLRLALACSDDGEPNRHVCETVFRHVWESGLDPVEPGRMAELARHLAPRHDPSSERVKGQLRANTDSAVASGIFGVPMFEVQGRLIWGLDALPMLRAAMLDDDWFVGPDWQQVNQVRNGLGQ
jgi:2-hydroxychromene-2-carboxylate isomerase